MNHPSPQSLQEASAVGLDPRAREVLDSWFGAPDSADYNQARAQWFQSSDTLDAKLRSRFLALHQDAAAGKCDAWAATPLGACALIIVLDQFSRNLYRNQPQAFAQDAHALEIARTLIKQNKDRHLPTFYHRWFVYLPFEHDESMQSQDESLHLFTALKEEAGLTAPLEWAIKHAEVIKRFGRYPHRNKILGRPSSAAEEAFLQEPGSSF